MVELTGFPSDIKTVFGKGMNSIFGVVSSPILEDLVCGGYFTRMAVYAFRGNTCDESVASAISCICFWESGSLSFWDDGKTRSAAVRNSPL